MENQEKDALINLFNDFQRSAHINAVNKGFWDNAPEEGTSIALMHEELSEALGAARTGNPPDKHLPHLDSLTVEFADVIIRIADFAGRNNLPVMQAVIEKHEYNKSRPRKHGKEF